MEASLSARLDALAVLENGYPDGAKEVEALINQVDAQTYKKITPQAASEIIAQIDTIFASLGV